MSGSICCRIYIWVFWYSIVSCPLIFQRYLTCLIPSWLLCILVWFCFYISWVCILTFIAFILHSKNYCKRNLAYWEEFTNKDNTALFIVFTQGLAWWWQCTRVQKEERGSRLARCGCAVLLVHLLCSSRANTHPHHM